MTDRGTRTVILGALLVLAVVSSAFAFNEPDGFRGVPWGATEAQMRKAASVVGCEDYARPDRWQGDRNCFVEFKIGDIAVDSLYVFRGNKFVKVIMRFPSPDFARLVTIFQERYGEPTTKSRDLAEWVGTRVNISVRRYLSQGAEGQASLVTLEMQESKRLRDEQTKDAAKGL
jgi:hypothetical protein